MLSTLLTATSPETRTVRGTQDIFVGQISSSCHIVDTQ